MISFRHKGNFSNTERMLKNAEKVKTKEETILMKYGERGVAALRSATPLDSGETANSWFYEIYRRGDTVAIEFGNRNVNKGVPIAIILQYGHGTRNGGYVQGRDYINPAIQPIFDQIEADARKEVAAL